MNQTLFSPIKKYIYCVYYVKSSEFANTYSYCFVFLVIIKNIILTY